MYVMCLKFVLSALAILYCPLFCDSNLWLFFVTFVGFVHRPYVNVTNLFVLFFTN